MKSAKHFIAFALALLMLCAALPLACAEQPVAVAHYAQDGVTIDASLEEWNLSTPIVLDQEEQVIRDRQAWEGTDDLSCKVYLMWDEEYLYLAAEVMEDTPYGAIDMLPVDGEDNFKLYLSTDSALDPQRTEYATNDFLVYLLIDNLYWDTAVDRNMVPKDARKRYVSNGMDGGQNVLEGYTVFSVETEGGFIYEAAIPWACFSNEKIPVYTPAVGDMVNFDFAITDIFYPCPGTQYIPQMAWTGDLNINSDPSLWGRLLFQ